MERVSGTDQAIEVCGMPVGLRLTLLLSRSREFERDCYPTKTLFFHILITNPTLMRNIITRKKFLQNFKPIRYLES